ncbi:hypothetical protein HME9304_01239 [Flagellimonas maritima]|uniref:TlpA family protein disulfide reductase n=1 Tax=Flagellimonas maritima TaxID=1383885 RepID=A0A2Z4LR98_9FLAO|nr:thioredoxin-like domain-containing protein [Allomuricauda aurantiaca]AWX44239.1 hypothetical protein HME9304_01239 [Allomuricauda aurantiaca]
MAHLGFKSIRLMIVLAFLMFFGYGLKAQVNQPDSYIQIKALENGNYLSHRAWLINKNGDTIPYTKFKGKWLLIDYWSSGCVPCIKEFPFLNSNYNKLHPNLVLISAYIGKNKKRWYRDIKKFDLQFPHYYTGTTYKNPFLTLNLRKLGDKSNDSKLLNVTPQYVLISPTGLIVDKNMPKPSSANFKKVLHKYIANTKTD